MITDVTKFAAMISGSLKQVDNNMLSRGSNGSANQIDINKFIAPEISSPRLATEPLPIVGDPYIGPQTIPSAPVTISQHVPTPTIATASEKHMCDIVHHLDRIATELSKINKKMTSIQKYLNNQTNEQSTVRTTCEPTQENT